MAFTLSPGIARTRLEVLSEKLDFDCAEAEREAACRFEARYRLRNGKSEAEVIDAAFLGLRMCEVCVRFDEEPLPVTEEQVDRIGSTSGSGETAPARSSPENALGRCRQPRPAAWFPFTTSSSTNRSFCTLGAKVGQLVAQGTADGAEIRTGVEGKLEPVYGRKAVLLAQHAMAGLHATRR